MKIGMVFYDMQEGGGLEEYAATLAVGLQQQGHQVSVVSTAWVPSDNQYLRRLRKNKVSYVQLPKWISYLASDWDTKDKLQTALMWVLSPVVYLLALVVFGLKRKPWKEAVISTHGWLRGKLMSPFVRTDWRKPFTRLLLNWWRIRWQPDILHIQGYTTNLLFVIEWAHAKSLPIIYEEHQTPDPQFNWWQGFQQTINKASVVIAVSEKSAEGLRNVAHVTQPIVVRGPLLPDPIVAGWQKNVASLPPDNPIRITTVARLSIAKGLKYLLETIKLVQKKYPSTQFKVYGDGDLRQELLDYAGELGLNGPEIFVGPFTSRAELSGIMANTDIFVMSSLLEGQPLAVVEAMAYGCPIVTTAVGGIPELITDRVNGLLCMPKDPHCLATKICALIENPDFRAEIGRAARQSYEQGPFQPIAVSQFFLSLYESVLQQQKHPNSAQDYSYST